jgi:hypothetical protein
MGQICSKICSLGADDEVKNVNYNCPICRSTNNPPNIAGRFFIINDKECQCNGCNTIFKKEFFYRSIPYNQSELHI